MSKLDQSLRLRPEDGWEEAVGVFVEHRRREH
jgi:hypothetical protein